MSSRPVTESWQVDPAGFPADGGSEDQLRFALRYAVLAPSGHNTQPWRFHVDGDSVEVHADRMRALSVVDPANRELVISCGAALFFLRIALRRFGLDTDVRVLHAPDQPNLLATVRLAGAVEPDADDVALADAIPRRHTNRRPYQDRPVPDETVSALEAVAAAEGAWLEAVADLERKRALAALIAEGNRIQFADDAFRGELASWIRAAEADDGMPTHGVPADQAGERAEVLPLRTFETGTEQATSDRDLANGSPLLVVLGTDSDDERAWLACGQALAHVLLRLTADGLAASFLNQPIEVASLRPLVAEALGRTGHADVLLRVGYAPPAPPTGRRALNDVVA